MLHQLTQNKFSRLTLIAGLCLATVFANQLDPNATQTTETTFNEMTLDGMMQNGANLNGVVLNGLSFNGLMQNGLSFNGLMQNGVSPNGANLNGVGLNGLRINGVGLGANGTNPNRFELTAPTLATAVLKQKPIQQIHLDGSQIALKIKRSD